MNLNDWSQELMRRLWLNKNRIFKPEVARRSTVVPTTTMMQLDNINLCETATGISELFYAENVMNPSDTS